MVQYFHVFEWNWLGRRESRTTWSHHVDAHIKWHNYEARTSGHNILNSMRRNENRESRIMLLLNYRIHHARNLLHAPLAAKCPSVTRAGTNKFVKILLANKTRPSSSCRLDENRSKQIRSDQRRSHYDVTEHWNALWRQSVIHSIKASNSDRVTINLLVVGVGWKRESPLYSNFRYDIKSNWSNDLPDKWQLQKLAFFFEFHSLNRNLNRFDSFSFICRVCEHLLSDCN